MSFLSRLFSGKKDPAVSAGRGVSKKRPVSSKGTTSGSRQVQSTPTVSRKRTGPKTMSRQPPRKGVAGVSVGLPKRSPVAGRSTTSSARKRSTARFRKSLTRDDR